MVKFATLYLFSCQTFKIKKLCFVIKRTVWIYAATWIYKSQFQLTHSQLTKQIICKFSGIISRFYPMLYVLYFPYLVWLVQINLMISLLQNFPCSLLVFQFKDSLKNWKASVPYFPSTGLANSIWTSTQFHNFDLWTMFCQWVNCFNSLQCSKV